MEVERRTPRSQSQSRPVVACSRTAAGPFGQGQQHRRRPSASVYSPSLARLVSKDGSPSCVNVPAVAFLDCRMVLGCWALGTCVIDVLVCVDLQIRCRRSAAWSKIGRAHNCTTETYDT